MMSYIKQTWGEIVMLQQMKIYMYGEQSKSR